MTQFDISEVLKKLDKAETLENVVKACTRKELRSSKRT